MSLVRFQSALGLGEVNLSWARIGLIGAGAFLGYCIYFDYRRTHHPDYMQRVLEKRRIREEEELDALLARAPDLSSPEKIKTYCMTELQKGETLFMTGSIEESVVHFANASVSGGGMIIDVLRQSLPGKLIEMITAAVPAARQRIYPKGQPIGRIRPTVAAAQPTVQPAASRPPAPDMLNDLE